MGRFLKGFGQFFKAPVFPGQPVKNRVANHLFLLVIISLVGLLILAAYVIASGEYHPLWLLMPTAIVFQVVVLLMTRRGYVKQAAIVFIASIWLLDFLFIMSTSGERAIGFAVLIVDVFMAGLLLNMEGALVVTVASLVASLVLIWVDPQSYLPSDVPVITLTTTYMIYGVLFSTVLAIIYLAIRSVDDALDQARAELKERRQVEEALSRSLARQKALLHAMPDLIFEMDRNGVYLDFIPAPGLEPFVPREQLLGQNMVDVLPHEVAGMIQAAIERAFQTGEIQTIEYGLPSAAGKQDFEARIAVSQADTAMCVVRDITHRKHAESQIRQYADIVRNIQVGMYVVQAEDLQDDHTLRVIAANPAALRSSEKTAEEVIGKRMDEVFLTLRAKGFPQKYIQVLQTGEPVELEDIYYDDQGEIANAYSVKVFALAADIVGVVFEDVSERKKAQERERRFTAELEMHVKERTAQLEATNRELETFAYSVSHDLRSPLRGINGYSKILLDDYAPLLDEQGQGYLDRIRQASQGMSDMIEALLALSRITRARLEYQVVDLSQIAQEALASLAENEPSRRVISVVAPGMQADGDPRLLRIALENMLQNAWKYTARQLEARIEFTSSDVEGKTVYHITDNGVGFDMAYANKIFGAFQRLHSAEEFPGSGIGLATVQRIIHRHGGRVWVQAAVGKGATFYFILN